MRYGTGQPKQTPTSLLTGDQKCSLHIVELLVNGYILEMLIKWEEDKQYVSEHTCVYESIGEAEVVHGVK